MLKEVLRLGASILVSLALVVSMVMLPPLNYMGRDYPAKQLDVGVVLISNGKGFGTGWVIASGLIATNAHVVGEATEVMVTDFDGNDLIGKVVHISSSIDMAIVKVEGLSAPVLPMGEEARRGDKVSSIGNGSLMGWGHTHGTVDVPYYIDMSSSRYILANMKVSGGDSGSPVFNTYGEVVGMISAAVFNGVSSDSRGQPEGLALYVPIELIKKELAIFAP